MLYLVSRHIDVALVVSTRIKTRYYAYHLPPFVTDSKSVAQDREIGRSRVQRGKYEGDTKAELEA